MILVSFLPHRHEVRLEGLSEGKSKEDSSSLREEAEFQKYHLSKGYTL